MGEAGGWREGLTGMEEGREGGKGRPQQVSLCSAQALYAVAQSILVQGTTKQRNKRGKVGFTAQQKSGRAWPLFL